MARGRELLVVALVASCGGERHESRAVELSTLPPGAVAACAGAALGPKEVGAVASASSSSPSQAVALLAREARLARAARDRGLDRAPVVSLEIRAALGRALLHHFRDADATPYRDDEIQRVRQDHRADLDRPEAFRVAHAVVRLAEGDPPDKRARALETAKAIAAATSGSHGAAEFKSRAEKVPRGDLEVVVEELPPFDASGRAIDGSMSLDPAFAAGASRLARADEESAPVSSTFGYHVIHLVERLPARHATDAEIATLAAEELRANRARIAVQKVLGDSRAATPVEIERSVEDSLRALEKKTP